MRSALKQPCALAWQQPARRCLRACAFRRRQFLLLLLLLLPSCVWLRRCRLVLLLLLLLPLPSYRLRLTWRNGQMHRLACSLPPPLPSWRCCRGQVLPPLFSRCRRCQLLRPSWARQPLTATRLPYHKGAPRPRSTRGSARGRGAARGTFRGLQEGGEAGQRRRRFRGTALLQLLGRNGVGLPHWTTPNDARPVHPHPVPKKMIWRCRSFQSRSGNSSFRSAAPGAEGAAEAQTGTAHRVPTRSLQLAAGRQLADAHPMPCTQTWKRGAPASVCSTLRPSVSPQRCARRWMWVSTGKAACPNAWHITTLHREQAAGWGRC